jgi:hypothetical protein
MRTVSRTGRLRTVLTALARGGRADDQLAALQRLGLDQPRSISEWLERRLVRYALGEVSRS